ncbi:biotin/lipoyl-binding protein [Gemmatimonas sp.]|uniref:HlyD family secretion protein n=2 Tax=Gemmatimonas sp. TaxID=1962908 RepID=UPI0022C8CB41|nr:biotin/lipoyl-binding protein [Gemmatimonas sp.]MCZ8205956.1 biotin/lipoyl-binding protein [Gemmatimonas sp.]
MASSDINIERELKALPLETTTLLGAADSGRVVSRWLIGILLVLVAIMFLPWQQNVQGNGNVTALSPADRPQQLQSRIDGRIEAWFVSEGQFVKKGDSIVRISEIKEEYLNPSVLPLTQQQQTAKESAISEKLNKAAALAQQIVQLEQQRDFKLQQTANKVLQYQAEVRQATLEDSVARDQLRRRERLFRDSLGLVSVNDLQTFQIRVQSAAAKLVEKQQMLAITQTDLQSIPAEYGEKIAKSRSDRAATLAEVSEGRSDVAKLKDKVGSLTLRNSFYMIEAPQDGYVVRATRAGQGEIVKAGEPIVSIQPARPRKAVELYVKPMDVALLKPGRHVRVFFDGWPALQISGWPQVAVGTFGAQVAVIDQFPSADGRFRVLLVPDTTHDEDWPAQLRLGTGAEGWAMLDNVTVGWELWRQLNGFPLSIKPGDALSGDEVAGGKGKDGGGKK